MEGHQHQHQYRSNVHIDTGGGGDRFPQWSIQESRDFLMIRAELDPTFMQTKRNKLLWEVIATKMREKGYYRSAEQCKCKWKNLVTRYKGCETMEQGGMRLQFPFYNELQTIFTTRMHRMLWAEAEGGASRSKKRATRISSDEEDDNEDMSEGEKANTKSKKKRKIKSPSGGGGGGASSSSTTAAAGGSVMNSLKEILDEFMKKQMQTEMELLKAYEAREEERRKREMEWRQTMEILENERLMMEKRWREREEQRRIREEARAEKRDALITALLNKLQRGDL